MCPNWRTELASSQDPCRASRRTWRSLNQQAYYWVVEGLTGVLTGSGGAQ
jgi:hypothetical protein